MATRSFSWDAMEQGGGAGRCPLSHRAPASATCPLCTGFSLLETVLAFLRGNHPSIRPRGWEALSLPPLTRAGPKRPLGAFHTLSRVSGSRMGSLPGGDLLFPRVWRNEGLCCWRPPQAPLGTACLRREPMEETRSEGWRGTESWDPAEPPASSGQFGLWHYLCDEGSCPRPAV